MKYMYTVYNQKEYNAYSQFVEKYRDKISRYIEYLKKDLDVIDLPEYIVFSNLDAGTNVYRKISIPAYTNDVRMVITPEISVWKDIYLTQLDNYEDSSEVEYIKRYYDSIHENHILQLIGHELAHQSELFFNEFDGDFDEGIWFEEGMVEYISRKYFFSEEEYQKEKKANQVLIGLFEDKYGKKSLEEFGPETYTKTNDHIFYFYWRSFLAINELIEKHNGIRKVFELYRKWDLNGREVSLSEWFEVE